MSSVRPMPSPYRQPVVRRRLDWASLALLLAGLFGLATIVALYGPVVLLAGPAVVAATTGFTHLVKREAR